MYIYRAVGTAFVTAIIRGGGVGGGFIATIFLASSSPPRGAARFRG